MDRNEIGVCTRCRWARDVPTKRGPSYLRCARAAEDPSFPRYPRLPVVACRGFELERGSSEPD